MTDKIPIGKYRRTRSLNGEEYDNIEIKLKVGIRNLNAGDIITLDMIEPYESEAVRKVARYLLEHFSVSIKDVPINAKEIVDLVHEAEDADE